LNQGNIRCGVEGNSRTNLPSLSALAKNSPNRLAFRRLRPGDCAQPLPNLWSGVSPSLQKSYAATTSAALS
jgi:hypothetical protein